MNETRITLMIFIAVAIVMIALPIGMVLMASRQPSEAEALNGEISRFFLASEKVSPPGATRQILPEITHVLPAGLTADTVFSKLDASGFTCHPDANSANCSRPHQTDAHCHSDWRVSLVFDQGDKLKLSEADRRIACL